MLCDAFSCLLPSPAHPSPAMHCRVPGAIHCDFMCDCYDGCMCGRYSIAVEPSLIEERFGVRFDARFSGEMKPRYNAAPSQSLPVILKADPGKIVFSHWGIRPVWMAHVAKKDR